MSCALVRADAGRGEYGAYDIRIDDGVCRILDCCLDDRDVEAVLAHYSEDAQFVSPMARNLVCRVILRNKKELEDYSRTALACISSLEFKLDHAAWDEKRRELNVVYEANLYGERKRACEIMQFDTSGRQIRGEALYGAMI